MDDMIYKIAMAGMLHDIGKFMQRAELPLSELSKGMESDCSQASKGGGSFSGGNSHTAIRLPRERI